MAIDIIFGIIIIIGFLLGIKLMQSPNTAVWGNRLGALSMGAGFIFSLIRFQVAGEILFWVFVIIGALIGLMLARKVKMIQMPQTVAFFNGSGGAASAAVAVTAALLYSGEDIVAVFLSSAIALAIGTTTFFGSIIASGKLQGLISQDVLSFKSLNQLSLTLVVAGAVLALISPLFQGQIFILSWPFITIFFALYGVLMAMRVGGADMPVLISFLNSLSGIAAAISGLAVREVILVGTGALVGVAGLILTGIMCTAMNRSLAQVLSGLKPASAHETSDVSSDESIVAEKETADPGETKSTEPEETEDSLSASQKAKEILLKAKKTIVVPGYGLAVAQAQMELKSIIDLLEEEGAEVKLAIHPVAGRMPGHMNVLLAEVGIDHEKLWEMDSINPEFNETDAVIVVGACDVVNPAASTSTGTPISGMPILEVNKAKNVIVCNLDDSPGYSGVPNTLYEAENITAIWGDAKENLDHLYSLLKE